MRAVVLVLSVLAYYLPYLHLYALHLQILYPMLAYVCLLPYLHCDLQSYDDLAVSYGEVYGRGEPIGLLSLCDPI